MTWEPENTEKTIMCMTWEPGNTGTPTILNIWETGNTGIVSPYISGRKSILKSSLLSMKLASGVFYFQKLTILDFGDMPI